MRKRVRLRSFPWSTKDPALLSATYQEQRCADRNWETRCHARVKPELPSVRQAQLFLAYLGEDWPHSSGVSVGQVGARMRDMAKGEQAQ